MSLEGAGGGAAIAAGGPRHDFAGEGALKGLDLDMPAGLVYGVIGADGAGKTTLMRVLTTLLRPSAGEAKVLGWDLDRDFKSIRRSVGYMPQRFSLYPDLTVAENLEFFSRIFGVTGAEGRRRKDELLAFAALGPFTGRRAEALSGGMKQKLALSCTLIHRPRLLFLDEPTIGVDPVARRDFWRMIRELKGQGVSALVSTPYMDEAALCDRLLLLHRGRALAVGAPAELLAGYPLRLYRVEGESPLGYPASWPRPAGLAEVYAVGGALHAAVPAESGLAAGDVLAALRARAPAANRVAEIRPQVEDLFVHLLAAREAA